MEKIDKSWMAWVESSLDYARKSITGMQAFSEFNETNLEKKYEAFADGSVIHSPYGSFFILLTHAGFETEKYYTIISLSHDGVDGLFPNYDYPDADKRYAKMVSRTVLIDTLNRCFGSNWQVRPL